MITYLFVIDIHVGSFRNMQGVVFQCAALFSLHYSVSWAGTIANPY